MRRILPREAALASIRTLLYRFGVVAEVIPESRDAFTCLN